MRELMLSIALILAAAGAHCDQAKPRTVPIKTSVCKLYHFPERYQSKDVEVKGVTVGGIHGIFMTSKNCPESAVELGIGDQNLGRPDVHRFFVALYHNQHAFDSGRVINATIYGRFSYSTGPRGVIDVNGVLAFGVLRSSR